MQVIRRPHWLLVTLVLVNAAATEVSTCLALQTRRERIAKSSANGVVVQTVAGVLRDMAGDNEDASGGKRKVIPRGQGCQGTSIPMSIRS